MQHTGLTAWTPARHAITAPSVCWGANCITAPHSPTRKLKVWPRHVAAGVRVFDQRSTRRHPFPFGDWGTREALPPDDAMDRTGPWDPAPTRRRGGDGDQRGPAVLPPPCKVPVPMQPRARPRRRYGRRTSSRRPSAAHRAVCKSTQRSLRHNVSEVVTTSGPETQNGLRPRQRPVIKLALLGAIDLCLLVPLHVGSAGRCERWDGDST